MAAPFNLTAQINLQGPTNLKPIVSKIKRELGSITTDINIDIKASSARTIGNITSRLKNLSTAAKDANNNILTLNQSLSQLASGFNSLSSATSGSVSTINTNNNALKSSKKTIQETRTEIEEFGKQSGLAIRRFAAFSTVTGVVYGLANAFTAAFKEFIIFNKEIVRLSQVTNQSVGDLRGVAEEITRLSTSLGVASSDLLEVSVTLAQAGLSAADTQTALEALAKSALAPSFESLKDTTEGSIAVLRQFGLQANELESALGSINAVAAAFAVESSDLITAIQRTGGVFASASKGVSTGTEALNEFLAIFTSVRATTRESAETIATGLRTIFTRIQRGETIDALKEYGIVLTDLENKFVGPFEAVKRLSDGLNQLDPRDIRFAQIVEELGGFRQIGKVIPLIQQFATSQEALKIAQRGQASLAQDAITAQQSLAVQFTKTRENFLALVRELGDSTTFKALTDITFGLANGLINLTRALEPLLPLLLTFTAIKIGSGITQFASGFSRGFGGGGIGGAPTIPGTPSPAGPAGAAAASTSAAISANTTAISTLATHITALIASANALNASVVQNNTLLASRPRPRGFARGGFVPGVGNRDTVPAMLTPGEFVINKKAVQAIGPENFANGGIIQKFANGGIARQKRLGYAILKYQGIQTPTITSGDIFNAATTDQKQLLQNNNLLNQSGQGAFGRGTVGPYALTKTGLDPNVRKQFNTAIDSGIIAGINRTVRSLFESTGGENGIFAGVLPADNPAVKGATNKKNFLASINPGAKATFFEEILNRIENQGVYDNNIDPNRPFDFIGGLPRSSAKLFPSLSGIDYIDAKSSAGAASNRDMAGKVASQLILESGGVLSGLKRTAAQTTKINAAVLKGIESFTGGMVFTAPDLARASGLITKGNTPNTSELKINELLQAGLIEKVTGGKYRVKTRGLADGGSISGSDTVPAMLTPGEFVVSKSAAQSIGYSTLHKINKMRGYNKGGIVGGVQHFAAGGQVGSLDLLAIGSILTATLQPQIEKLASSFGKLDTEVSSFGTALSGAVRESTSLISSAAIGLAVSGASGRTRGATIAAGGIGGAVGGFIQAGSARNLELALKENARALSAFDKLVQEASAATDDRARIEASNKLDEAFAKLVTTFNKNNEAIDISERWKSIGSAIADSTTTFLTLTTSLAALNIAIQTNTASISRNTAATAVGGFASMTGSMGAAAQTTAQAQAAASSIGLLARFGTGLATVVGFVSKFAGGLGLLISAVQLGITIFNAWNSGAKKSAEESSKLADALRKATETSADYTLANQRYTNVILSRYNDLNRQRAGGGITEEDFFRAIGALSITAQQNATGGVNVPSAQFGNRFISDLNLQFRQFYKGQLESKGIFLDINKGIGEFLGALESRGQVQTLQEANIVLQSSVDEFIRIQFQKALEELEQLSPADAQKRYNELLRSGADGQQRIIQTVERYTGKVDALNLAQDAAALASRQLRLSFVTLNQILDNFGAASSRIVSETEASFREADAYLSSLSGQPRVNLDTEISRRLRVLNNLAGFDISDIEKTISDTLSSIDPNQFVNPQVREDFDKISTETRGLILGYRQARKELPTLIKEFANLPIPLRNREPIEKSISALFKDLQISDSQKRQFINAITDSIINSVDKEPITNIDDVLAKFPELGTAINDAKNLLIRANEDQAKTIEMVTSKANQLADTLGRLTDIELSRTKLVSDIGDAQSLGTEIRRALGQSIKSSQLNANLDRELQALTSGLSAGIDARSVGESLITEIERLRTLRQAPTDEASAKQQAIIVNNINKLTKAFNIITDSGNKLKNALDNLAEREKDLFQTPQQFFRDLVSDASGETARRFVTGAEIARRALQDPSREIGAQEARLIQEFGNSLRSLGATGAADIVDTRVVRGLASSLPPLFKNLFEPITQALLARTAQQKAAGLTPEVTAVKAAADEINIAFDIKEDLINLELNNLANSIGLYTEVINGQRRELFGSLQDAAESARKIQDAAAAQILSQQNIEPINQARRSLATALENSVFQIQQGTRTLPVGDITGGFIDQQIPIFSNLSVLFGDISKLPIDQLQTQINNAITQLSDPNRLRQLNPTVSGGRLFGLLDRQATQQEIKDLINALIRVQESIKQIPSAAPIGSPSRGGLLNAPRTQTAPPTSSSLNISDKPFSKFISNFEQSMITQGDDLATTLINSLSTAFNNFGGSNGPIQKFQDVTNKFITDLREFNAAGGIKGPNIPNEVTVAVSFDENLVVQAQRTNDNETLLAQIGVLVEETVTQQLNNLQIFGRPRV